VLPFPPLLSFLDDMKGCKIVSNVRAELNHFAKHRKDLNALHHEKANLQATLTSIREQIAQAKRDLTAVMNDLNRGSSLVSLDAEIAKARSTRDVLKVEIGALDASIAVKKKELEDLEHQRVAALNEVQALRTERSEANAYMARVKMQLAQVNI
jgi:chromosome segregation ATPase